MYTLTLNNTVLHRSATLEGVWRQALTVCGHMTLAAFTERGYAIQREVAA